MHKLKELHLWLDFQELSKTEYHNVNINITAFDTRRHIVDESKSVLHTVVPYYLSFEYAERLFVHCKDGCHEITTGECAGSNKKIKKSHNLEKLLFDGNFSWFRQRRPCAGRKEVKNEGINRA